MIAGAAVAGPASAQPTAPSPTGLSESALAGLRQMFDMAPAAADGEWVFTARPDQGCAGYRVELRTGIARPADAPRDLQQWLAAARRRAGTAPSALHAYQSPSGIGGLLLWFDRSSPEHPNETEHVTLGALPRSDGLLQTLEMRGSGRCSGLGHAVPLRCPPWFDIDALDTGRPRLIRDAAVGYAIDLPFDWNFISVGYCGNSFMMSEEVRRRSFYITADFGRSVGVLPAPAPYLHLEVMEQPPGDLSIVARDDVYSRDWTTEDFAFDDGSRGIVRRTITKDFWGATYYRMLGTKAAKLAVHSPSPSPPPDLKPLEDLIRTFRAFSDAPEHFDADGRIVEDLGLYTLTRTATWPLFRPRMTSGSIAGDCEIVGPPHGDPTAELGIQKFVLRLHVERRSDLDAENADGRVGVPPIPPEPPSLKRETASKTQGTVEGVAIEKSTVRLTRVANPSNPRAAAIKRPPLTSLAVQYRIHLADGLTDLSASANVFAADAAADIDEMDRIMQSLRFSKGVAKSGHAENVTPKSNNY